MQKSLDDSIARAAALLASRFDQAPRIVGHAPARVELLGNHTDYNRGLVLAAAIDRHTCVAAAPNGSELVRVWSDRLQELDTFPVRSVVPGARGTWSNYVRGTVAALIDSAVAVRGFDAAIVGDVPLGSGLSSSASLECATAMAVLGLFGRGPGLDPRGMALAELLRHAEQRFAGVACGILDQFACLYGQAGHALFLDCDTLEHEPVAFGSHPPAIVVIDTMSPRQLAHGKYNERRDECRRASEQLHQWNPELPRGLVASLRDIPWHVFAEHQVRLDPPLARRVRHVLTENQRVRTGLELLRRGGDVRSFGQLMLESHRSSRDDFENSSAELDCLMELASAQPGFLGGKLSGAGWGGSTVHLVETGRAHAFASLVAAAYVAQTGTLPAATICQPAAGAGCTSLA